MAKAFASTILLSCLISQVLGVDFRHDDPIVMNGNDLYELIGVKPEFIVGFRYESDDTWTQIPIQVDEMHVQKWEVIKPGECRYVLFYLLTYRSLNIKYPNINI